MRRDNIHQKHKPTNQTKPDCKRKRCASSPQTSKQTIDKFEFTFKGTTIENGRQHGNRFLNPQLAVTQTSITLFLTKTSVEISTTTGSVYKHHAYNIKSYVLNRKTNQL
jgi:hypothetical protein